MSAILRNTLRFVGTAKCATNNSTKYMQTMALTTNCLNNSLALNGPNNLHHHKSKRLYHSRANEIWTRFWKNVSEILLILANVEKKTSHVGDFIVSLRSGKMGLITDELKRYKKNVTLPPILCTKFNGARMRSICNRIPSEEKEKSFNYGNLNVSLYDGKIKLKVKDTDEIFIVNHVVHVEAFQKKETLNLRDFIMPPRIRVSDIITHSSKLTSKTPSGKIFGSMSSTPKRVALSLSQWKKFGSNNTVTKEEEEEDLELTDTPNEYGEMKLQFPMNVSLEGARQEVKIEDSDDNLIVYNTVDIQAYKETNENFKKKATYKKKSRKSKIGEIEIQLESGDLLITPRYPNNKSVYMKHEVLIVVDFDNEVPFITVCPRTKMRF